MGKLLKNCGPDSLLDNSDVFHIGRNEYGYSLFVVRVMMIQFRSRYAAVRAKTYESTLA